MMARQQQTQHEIIYQIPHTTYQNVQSNLNISNSLNLWTSSLSNRRQSPGSWQWLSIATNLGYLEYGYIKISAILNRPISPRVTWLVTLRPKAKASGWLQSTITKMDGLVTEHCHLIRCHMLRCVFTVECDIARFLCAVHVFDVRASSSYPRYLCTENRFFCGLQCWARPCRKTAYSLTHRAYLMPQELKLSLR